MKKLFRAITFTSFLLLLSCNQYSPSAKITFKVVDESGHPIDGVGFSVGYQTSTSSGTKDTLEEGLTDTTGQFSSTGKTNGHITYLAVKSGYYPSRGSYDFYEKTFFSWSPSNPLVEVTLREIRNPVPMYARDTSRTKLELPIVGEDVGFDLVEYDWVAPYGRGKNADFVFNLNRSYTNRNNYQGELSVKFKEEDGIQPFNIDEKTTSAFKGPYNAPKTSYIDKITIKKSKRGGILESDFDRNINYFFRVRSEATEGQHLRSMYGKIYGDITYFLVSTETAHLSFKYYLNPDYTTNMEFDSQRNLFKRLEKREKVKIY